MYGLALRAGVLTYPTRDRVDTVRHIVDLYRMWTDDSFEDHTSHLVVYQPHGILQQSDFIKALASWPRVGRQIAKAAERVFKGSVRKAAMAGPKEWADIETLDNRGKYRRVGEKVATDIDTFLEGKKR